MKRIDCTTCERGGTFLITVWDDTQVLAQVNGEVKDDCGTSATVKSMQLFQLRDQNIAILARTFNVDWMNINHSSVPTIQLSGIWDNHTRDEIGRMFYGRDWKEGDEG